MWRRPGAAETLGEPRLDIEARHDKHADVGWNHVESVFHGPLQFIVWRRVEQARHLVAISARYCPDPIHWQMGNSGFLRMA